jgi:hypothetical protein
VPPKFGGRGTSGTILFIDFRGLRGRCDDSLWAIEIWAELEIPGSKAKVPGIKVSKSKSVGNVKTTFARDLTPAEMERAR